MKKESTKKILMANVFALTTSIVWIACSLLVWLLPSLSTAITGWWVHGLDIELLGNWNITVVGFVGGGITVVISSWLVGFVFGWSWDTLDNN